MPIEMRIPQFIVEGLSHDLFFLLNHYGGCEKGAEYSTVDLGLVPFKVDQRDVRRQQEWTRGLRAKSSESIEP